MKLALASDHAGVTLRGALFKHLMDGGHEVRDLGPSAGESVDYPDQAGAALAELQAGRVERVVLICGTGQGMAMSANKLPGVRAAVVSDPFSAQMAALHNDAKVLCMGERVIGQGVAIACLDAWMNATFEGGRHARRVEKLEALRPR